MINGQTMASYYADVSEGNSHNTQCIQDYKTCVPVLLGQIWMMLVISLIAFSLKGFNGSSLLVPAMQIILSKQFCTF